MSDSGRLSSHDELIFERERHAETMALLIAAQDKIRKLEKTEYQETTDAVNHPEHYGGDTTYETIKVIEAWGLGFHLGNAVKYISRAGKKGNAIQDLEKAVWFLQREIERQKEQTT